MIYYRLSYICVCLFPFTQKKSGGAGSLPVPALPLFHPVILFFLFPALKELTFLIIADCRFRKLHVAMENMS